MGGFANDTNTNRVAKMCDTLALIQKSARSNKASDEDVRGLLTPLLEVLSEMNAFHSGGAVPEPPELPLLGEVAVRAAPPDHVRVERGGDTPIWVSVRQMCQEAPLSELTTALAVYMNRVDEALHDVKKLMEEADPLQVVPGTKVEDDEDELLR